jgi:hypothetical protein
VTVIFPMDDEPFDAFLQRQAPKGWAICEAAQGGYGIMTDTGFAALIDSGGTITDGWKVAIRDTGISREFTVTAPDGRELWFHDCYDP